MVGPCAAPSFCSHSTFSCMELRWNRLPYVKTVNNRGCHLHTFCCPSHLKLTRLISSVSLASAFGPSLLTLHFQPYPPVSRAVNFKARSLIFCMTRPNLPYTNYSSQRDFSFLKGLHLPRVKYNNNINAIGEHMSSLCNFSTFWLWIRFLIALFSDSVRNVSLSPSLSYYSPGSVITCIAKGHPLPTFKWQEIENDFTWTDIQNQKGSEFNMSSVTTKRYRCVAMNAVRDKSYNAASQEFQVKNSGNNKTNIVRN